MTVYHISSPVRMGFMGTRVCVMSWPRRGEPSVTVTLNQHRPTRMWAADAERQHVQDPKIRRRKKQLADNSASRFVTLKASFRVRKEKNVIKSCLVCEKKKRVSHLNPRLRWPVLPGIQLQSRPASLSSWMFEWVWSKHLPNTRRKAISMYGLYYQGSTK